MDSLLSSRLETGQPGAATEPVQRCWIARRRRIARQVNDGFDWGNMNILDSAVLHFVNQFSQQPWTCNKLVLFLANNHLLKGGVLVSIIWWMWFENKKYRSHNREHIVATLFSCVVAMTLARGLALTLPFRLRPLYEEGLSFRLPYGMKSTVLEGWSSFPSDHAVLFFSLCTGLCFISKKVGAFALLYTTMFIAFPRIYLGLHYPSDIFVGAIIGITISILGNIYFTHRNSLQAITNS